MIVKNLFRRIKRPFIPLLAIAAFIFAMFSIVIPKSKQESQPVTMPPTTQFEQNVAGIGIIEPKSELISIGTELSGVARAVHVKVGDAVKKNEPLFTIDQRDIGAQIEILKEGLAAAKIQAEDAQAQFDIVNQVKDSRALSKDEYNRKKYARNLAIARVNEVQARLDQAETTKERLTIHAPIDGTILEVNIRPGEFAVSDDAKSPLMRMGDVSTLHVRAEIDEQNATDIKKNAPAKGFLRGNSSRVIPLKFVRFELYVKPKQNLSISGQRVDTRVIQVIYALPEETQDVFVGQQMDVFIEKGRSINLETAIHDEEKK
jgi:HlyD family secretion protein